MGYRDDVDTLYQRSLILQKELDQATERLAQRERELEHLRGDPFVKQDTSPGLRQLRELPPAETLLSRLVDTISQPVSPPKPPEWLDSFHRRAVVLEQSRDRLDRLDDETLVLIGALIEELATEPATRGHILASIRPIVDAIGKVHTTRKTGRP